jgi:hypothetical protein
MNIIEQAKRYLSTLAPHIKKHGNLGTSVLSEQGGSQMN